MNDHGRQKIEYATPVRPKARRTQSSWFLTSGGLLLVAALVTFRIGAGKTGAGHGDYTILGVSVFLALGSIVVLLAGLILLVTGH